MSQIILTTAPELADILAQKARELRLRKGWTRQTMAQRAGVTHSSLKRFENTGQASLELVLRLAQALGRMEDFAQVFDPPVADTMDELESQSAEIRRQRGSR